VVSSILTGDQQTMHLVQQTMDHKKISSITIEMQLSPDRSGKETHPIQTRTNEAELIFRSELSEGLDCENRVEDVALCLDTMKRCISNMLVAFNRDTPQIKNTGLALPLDLMEQGITSAWLLFTVPELSFPLILDKYRRPIHPAVKRFMRRYVSDSQDWDKVDDPVTAR